MPHEGRNCWVNLGMQDDQWRKWCIWQGEEGFASHTLFLMISLYCGRSPLAWMPKYCAPNFLFENSISRIWVSIYLISFIKDSVKLSEFVNCYLPSLSLSSQLWFIRFSDDIWVFPDSHWSNPIENMIGRKPSLNENRVSLFERYTIESLMT